MDKYQEKENIGRDAWHNSSFYFARISRSEGTTGKFDRQDERCTGLTGEKYLVEIKCYSDPSHPRPYSKFPDYQIDYEKIENLCDDAQKEDRIPLLFVKFDDCEIVWKPQKDVKTEWRYVNKYGQNYGAEKERSLQAFLDIKDAIDVTYPQDYLLVF